VLQVHHLHQVSMGGLNEDENLITVCSNCHAGRHAKDGAQTATDDLLHPSLDPWAAPDPD
jgi:5-methylcytosine-specific restriction endonuclease McrA